MTEKLLTFPSSTSPDPGDRVNRSKFNFFPEQHQHKPTTKTFVPGQHARTQDFFVRGWVGAGSRLLNIFYSLQRGSNGFITHFQGGPTFSRGGGGPIANLYRNPYNYNL